MNFWRKFDRRGPYKNSENLVLSPILWRKYFLDKFFVPLIKRSVSPQFKAIFGNLNFWRKFNRRGPYKNSENLVLSQIVLRKYFLAKLFVPFIKRSVSPQFKAIFGNLNFWRKIQQAKPYKYSENLVLSPIVWRKYFFGWIVCSFHQKKCFYTILGNFWKFEFLTEIRQGRTLQK